MTVRFLLAAALGVALAACGGGDAERAPAPPADSAAAAARADSAAMAAVQAEADAGIRRHTDSVHAAVAPDDPRLGASPAAAPAPAAPPPASHAECLAQARRAASPEERQVREAACAPLRDLP